MPAGVAKALTLQAMHSAIVARAGDALAAGVGVKPTGVGFARRRPGPRGRRSEHQDDNERSRKRTDAAGAVADRKRDVRCNHGIPLWTQASAQPDGRRPAAGESRRHVSRAFVHLTSRGKDDDGGAGVAQQKAMPVGRLSPRCLARPVLPSMDAFRRGLSDTGYVEGQNLAIEYR